MSWAPRDREMEEAVTLAEEGGHRSRRTAASAQGAQSTEDEARPPRLAHLQGAPHRLSLGFSSPPVSLPCWPSHSWPLGIVGRALVPPGSVHVLAPCACPSTEPVPVTRLLIWTVRLQGGGGGEVHLWPRRPQWSGSAGASETPLAAEGLSQFQLVRALSCHCEHRSPCPGGRSM